MKAVAIVGWSGSGEFEDLRETVGRKLGVGRGEAKDVGRTLLIAAADPVAVARTLSLLPGVAWIAVGDRFVGSQGYLKALVSLAKRYLSRGRTFKISAQVFGTDQTAGDLILAGNSELLAAIGGSRVDERRPQVRFRVSLKGTKGACGVEIRAGPGGSPTGGEWVSCLVSGGRRSSSMAWMAALAGLSVRLVHSRTDEASLRQVARLYSELSFRMDATRLDLILLEGGRDTVGRIGGWLHDHGGLAMAGVRAGSPEGLTAMARRFPNLAAPLVLVGDAEVGAVYDGLGLGKPAEGAPGGFTLQALERMAPYSEVRFGGVQADLSEVIDALKRR